MGWSEGCDIARISVSTSLILQGHDWDLPERGLSLPQHLQPLPGKPSFQISNSIQIETHIKAPLTLSTFVSHPSGSKLNSHHSEIQWRTVAFVENNVNITERIFRIIIRIHMAIHKKRTTTTTASCLDVHNCYKDMGWLFKTHLTCNIRYYFVT